MYNNVEYQIQEQSDLELIIFKVTLETATDVTYSDKDIEEIFGGGNYTSYAEYATDSTLLLKTNYTGGWGDKIEHVVYFVFVQGIIRAVTRELARNPKAIVQLDLNTHHHSALKDMNKVFKQHGFMFRPKFGHFVTYKAGKPKPKKVSNSLLNDIRTMVTNRICRAINTKVNGSFDIDYPNNKLAQIAAVRVAKFVGITYKQIFCEKDSCNETLIEYITRRAEPTVKDQTLQEIKQWWDEHYTTKFEI